MSQILTTSKQLFTPELVRSDSSSDLSAKNNKERMKDFKTLSLKRNSVMEHLFSFQAEKGLKKQSSTLFHSQKWGFAPLM